MNIVFSLPDDSSSDSLVDNNLDSPIILDSEIDTEVNIIITYRLIFYVSNFHITESVKLFHIF